MLQGALITIFSILSSFSVWGFNARVLIDEDQESKLIQGVFRLWVECESKKRGRCPTKQWRIPRGTWVVEPMEGGLQMRRHGMKKTYKFKGHQFRLRGGFLYEGQNVEEMKVFASDKAYQWVVSIPMDQYLYGVMSGEVPSQWSMESLKAQAVASRTYFLYKKQQRRGENYDVRSDILDQVFELQADKRKKLITAVDDTSGWVLVSKQKEQIFPTYFHADCGGHTSNESDVWGHEKAQNKSVHDVVCKSAGLNDWTLHVDRGELEVRLRQKLLLPLRSRLTSIHPRMDKGRAHVVDIIFDKKRIKRMKADDLRALLGYSKLRSANFDIDERWDSFIFSGRGFGHGVGLCQWGAERWAQQGRDFRFILEHYYPAAKLKKMSYKEINGRLAQLESL